MSRDRRPARLAEVSRKFQPADSLDIPAATACRDSEHARARRQRAPRRLMRNNAESDDAAPRQPALPPQSPAMPTRGLHVSRPRQGDSVVPASSARLDFRRVADIAPGHDAIAPGLAVSMPLK